MKSPFRQKGYVARAVACVVLVVYLAGCGGLIPIPGTTGKLKVLVTDKPFPFEFIAEALVTIERVDVRDAATEELVTIADYTDVGGKSFNLLDLQNGKTDLLADAEIPAGMYDQMRLVVTEGVVTLTDGRTFPLTVPSGDASGIILHYAFTVGTGSETSLLLDVDLSQAFSPIPGNAKDPGEVEEFKFTPSIAMRLINLVESASVGGTVYELYFGNPFPGVAVTVLNDYGDQVTSTVTDANGDYKIIGLEDGTYTFQFAYAGYRDEFMTDVVVLAGDTWEDVDVILFPFE